MTREEKTKDWCDVLSEMPLEQAQQVVKDVRKKWAEYLEYLGKEPCEKEPCEDAISREAVLDEINRVGVKGFETYDDYSQLYDFVDTLSSVTPRPKMGHWIYTLEDWNKWECSECGFTKRTDVHVNIGYKYCPECGAKMESEVKRYDVIRGIKG